MPSVYVHMRFYIFQSFHNSHFQFINSNRYTATTTTQKQTKQKNRWFLLAHRLQPAVWEYVSNRNKCIQLAWDFLWARSTEQIYKKIIRTNDFNSLASSALADRWTDSGHTLELIKEKKHTKISILFLRLGFLSIRCLLRRGQNYSSWFFVTFTDQNKLQNFGFSHWLRHCVYILVNK